MSGDRTLLRRGFTYVGEYLRAEPLVLGASIAGSVIFAAFSVLATVVLGHVIDDLLIPYFEGTGPEDSTTTAVLGEWMSGVFATYVAVNLLGYPITFVEALVIDSFVALVRSVFFFVPA
ncbi:MAG: hypothetical protein ACERLM_05335, partial [Acidimicrobiales bacterium]